VILGNVRALLEERPGRPAGVRALTAAQLFVLSFLGLIAIGTAGLLLLPGLYTGEGLGLVDALFTATSAVCVTGLIVVDTATYFTRAGQAWLLVLIQAGGLGILTFSTLILSLLGGRHLELEEAAGGHAAFLRHATFRSLLRTVMAVTFTLETLGAVSLWVTWRARFGAGEAVWHAVFHAVSAFCNAGFSTFSDSLVSVRTSPVTVGTIAFLVILGGLGFIVLEDVRARWLRRQTRRLSLHSRLVLTSTGILLAVGFALFLLFEARPGGTLVEMSWPGRVLNAFFMSVTPRTAGFNTVDYDVVTNPALLLTMLLMIVGGSPGSTAGGIKTVSLSVLVLHLASRLRGRGHVPAFDRTIPWETVHRAVGLVVGGLAILGVGALALMATESLTHGVGERTAFARLVFETSSAFGTVGLSMGSTPLLSDPGKLVTVLLMFLGRVGPAAVVAAMFTMRRAPHAEVRFAHEDVILG
jgi:trk system potassium uptake protein TrkH